MKFDDVIMVLQYLMCEHHFYKEYIGFYSLLLTISIIFWPQRNYPAPMQSAVQPSEDSITTLVSMGFDRNSARQALVQARNDVNVATNILLEAQSH